MKISHGTMGRAAGFTMMELLVTMTIAAILMAVGMPSYRYVTNSNRIAGEINGLLGDMQFARAEAIKEGRTVTVCVSQNGTSCADAGWNSGWIVFSDPTNVGTVDAGELPVLRLQAPFTGTDTFTSSNGVNKVTFNREGYAIGITNGTLLTLHDATSNVNWTRCLSINLSGMMTTLKSGATFNTVTCT